MAGYHNIFPGSDYGFEPKNDDIFLGFDYRTPVSNIGISTDPRTANQIKAVSDKLNTGAKVIEVSLLNAGDSNQADAVPAPHMDEIRRLKKLTGSELTLHGPIAEPTGIMKQGWDDTNRQQVERQMWAAIEKGQRLSDKGENMVITFHASALSIDPETVEYDENDKERKKKVTGLWAVDQATGNFQNIDVKEKHFPRKDGKPYDPYQEIDDKNKELWDKGLMQVNFHAFQGSSHLKGVLYGRDDENKTPEEIKQSAEDYKEIYKDYLKGDNFEEIRKKYPNAVAGVEHKLNEVLNADIYIKDAYVDLKGRFEEAYESAKNNLKSKDEEQKKRAEADLEKLEQFRKDIAPKVGKLEEDPTKIEDLAEEIIKGIRVLKTIQTPRRLKPLKEFAIDKASDTFSNLAYKAYKEYGDKPPIISIENPPAGGGLYRAEELRALVDESREKFAEKLVKEKKMSEKDAKKEAEKLIGATWDVGHINMLRQFGYTDKDLTEQTEKIAEVVKHVHLSDNFGMKHTELPMGMGNVPTKAHMEIIEKYNKQVKKIIEAGDWYQHFQTMPMVETFAAFGSPVYAMKGGPYRNQAGWNSGGYFSGYGMNPDIHHSMYGAGFSGLPLELGGQMQGGKSRLTGTPME